MKPANPLWEWSRIEWSSVGDRARFPPQKAFTLVELLVCIGVISILIGLLLPAVQAARASARRIQCGTSLRQIALAVHQHQIDTGNFPAGTMGERSERPWGSWLVSLLPYLERNSEYHEITAAYGRNPNPFDSSDHPLFSTRIALFTCAADFQAAEPKFVPRQQITAGMTSYLGCVGRNDKARDGVLYIDSKIKPRDITDGLRNTILCGERPASAGFDYGWWYAGVGNRSGVLDHTLGIESNDVSPYGHCFAIPYFPQSGSRFDECSASHFWSFHPGHGLSFAMADGSVHFVSYSAGEILLKLATRDGQEVATPAD